MTRERDLGGLPGIWTLEDVCNKPIGKLPLSSALQFVETEAAASDRDEYGRPREGAREFVAEDDEAPGNAEREDI